MDLRQRSIRTTGLLATAVAALALAAVGCGGNGGSGGTTAAATAGGGASTGEAQVAEGRELFKSNCSSCHTLAAADANGHVGPNLDDLKPDRAAVLAAIHDGPGAMPSNLYTGEKAEAVATFVSQSAGQ